MQIIKNRINKPKTRQTIFQTIETSFDNILLKESINFKIFTKLNKKINTQSKFANINLKGGKRKEEGRAGRGGSATLDDSRHGSMERDHGTTCLGRGRAP